MGRLGAVPAPGVWTALLALAAAVPVEAQTTYFVRGRVLLDGSLAPVEGVRVVVADSLSGRVWTGETEGGGWFKIRARGPRSVLAVGAEAPGFGIAGPVRVHSSDPIDDVVLVFRGDEASLLERDERGFLAFDVERLARGEMVVGGTVREADTARPIPEASVTLTSVDSGERISTQTNQDGRFTLVPPTWQGSMQIEVTALGYQEGEPETFTLEGEPVFLSVGLRARPIDLPALEVTVNRTAPILERWGVLDRVGRGGDVFMGKPLEQAIRSAGGRPSAIFVRIPGTVVQRGEPLFMRNMRPGFEGPCEGPDIFINGALARSGRASLVELPFDQAIGVPPEIIVAIETYRHPALVPPEFRNVASDCGAILVWTEG